MKERLIAWLTAFCLLLSLGAGFILPAAAEEGEKIEISTAEQLVALASGDLAGNYIQVADIDLINYDYTPIGTPDTPFTGTFDGNGYTIYGLTVEGDKSFRGLFGVNCGEIRNVTLAEDCWISGSSYVGAVAGFNQGVIKNCISRATVEYTAAEESATAQTYAIMSQNLCQWGDNDLTADSSYEDSRVNSRRPGMIKRIENSNPDILFFQEVSFKDYRYNGKTITAWDTFLRNTLTDFTICGTYRSNSDKEGVTVGFRKDKFELVEEGMFWLSENPDAPRSEQVKAWDAGCVRTAQFVVLQDKTNGQKIIACSTHTDHMGVIARDKGSKLVAERMAALQKKYPDALLAVGGDFNNSPSSQGYFNMEAGINGLLDDARYVAEERLNNIGTHGSIDDLEYVGGELNTIDYIYVNSATTEVPTFYVMNDNYNDLRPSDHEGVFSSIKVRENHFVGGICGANGGELRNIIAEGEVAGGEVYGSGTVLGNALLRAEYKAVFAKDITTDQVAGTEVSIGALSFEQLPESPTQLIVDLLNQSSGVFELREGQYAILQGCGQYELAKVVFRGVPKYCFVGSTFTFEVEEGLSVFLNGEPFDGRSIIVPSGGAVISVLEPIQSVTQAVAGGDFIIETDEDFLYLMENTDYFRGRGVTIHLFCDIDLSKELFADFGGFINPSFSWEGYGHTVSNWGSEKVPGGKGFYRITTGEGGANFIKNLNFTNCHVKGSNAAIAYSVVHPNPGLSGLPTRMELKNITIDQCSLVSTDQSSGMLLSRYGSTGEDYTVDISDIRITNCKMNASSKEHIGFVAGKIRTADGGAATFNISDCYLYGNTVENAVAGVGFVGGSVEGLTYATFRNIGVFRCTANGTGISLLTSDSHCAGAIKGEGLIFAENTLNTEASYMVEGVYADASATLQNAWSDAELTALIEGRTTEYTATTAEVMASGEPGWAVNAAQEAPAFWWAQDQTIYKPCKAEERLCKVELNLAKNVTQYLHMGDTLELPDIGENEYEIEGEYALEGRILTVKGDATVSAEIPVSMVDEAVSGGNYTVSSMEEWMTLYQNIDFFRNRNVTIHLRCDIDLSDEQAAEFTYFENPAFSFDGHNHTVSRWGSAEELLPYRGLFYITDGNYGVNYIKNLNLTDCHLGNGGGNQALLYSVGQGNDGLANLPTSLSLENIHFKDCSITANGENAAFLITRYGVAGADFEVNIKNCSVKGCILDVGGAAHKGLLFAKPRCTDAAGVFNISDCYLYGNTVTGAYVGTGLIFGTAEGKKTTVHVNNVGAVDNFLVGEDEIAYAGYCDESTIHFSNVFFEGNETTADAKYLFATNYTLGTVNRTNVYSDIEDLTSVTEGGSEGYFPTTLKLSRGEAAYTINQALSEPAFYWRRENGANIPTDKNHRTVKVTLALPDDTVAATLYAGGGDQLELSLAKDPDATFELQGEGTLEGNLYTLPEDGEDQKILVHTEIPEVFEPFSYPSVSEVAEPVTSGTYRIEDVEDWMYVYKYPILFNHKDVTLMLGNDLDLSDERAATFKGFRDVAFSLDGNGKTIRNWTSLKDEVRGNALFINYIGSKICNLNLENIEVSGGYARAILIGEYYGTDSLTIENVHVRNSVLDATTGGNQMAILLARPLYTASEGAVIAIKNCSVTDTEMSNSTGERINNAGLIVGSAYKDFNYNITDVLAKGCRVETVTGAGGIAIGAVENNSAVTLDRVGIFDCSIQPAETNELPGLFAGEMSGNSSLVLKNCMAAGNTADERESLAAVCHYHTTVTVSAENCFADFEPLEVVSTNNADGITASTALLAGMEQLPAAAFKSGEAAWRANRSSTLWLVDESFDAYPSFTAKEGFAAPFRVTFGEEAMYTNSRGILPEGVSQKLGLEEGSWMLEDAFITADTVYTADSDLTLLPHSIGMEGAIPEGESSHRAFCANGCGYFKVMDCTFGEWSHEVRGEKDVHVKVCPCGNDQEGDCAFEWTSHEDGTHLRKCPTCDYSVENEPCRYGDWVYHEEEGAHYHAKACSCGHTLQEDCTFTYAHVAETETHIGTCSVCLGTTAPLPCEMVPHPVDPPALGESGLLKYICAEGCGNERQEILAPLGDVKRDGAVTLADVVLLMRMLSGSVEFNLADPSIANVYTEDGYTENGGVNSADAITILRYLLNRT